ncbi:hypothetical protein KL86DYS1_11215 [uncultured Dysgonomonas sp.]|uniref:Uncharacterized protein n=1 Tax=uncultured Dysgonomonas sp. TaxID=206096 RepID=A0A212J5K1_9BACT|nr:hypothetical protein KL86DYS1_11215 [uncultured Dysgonomonas sp.]
MGILYGIGNLFLIFRPETWSLCKGFSMLDIIRCLKEIFCSNK